MPPPGRSENGQHVTGRAPRSTATARNGSSSSELVQVPAQRIRERALNFYGWKRHAEWLFGQYWRTGSLRALCAFVVHVIGMRARLVNEERRWLR
jgi:hypothetical protein